MKEQFVRLINAFLEVQSTIQEIGRNEDGCLCVLQADYDAHLNKIRIHLYEGKDFLNFAEMFGVEYESTTNNDATYNTKHICTINGVEFFALDHKEDE